MSKAIVIASLVDAIDVDSASAEKAIAKAKAIKAELEREIAALERTLSAKRLARDFPGFPVDGVKR